MTPKQAKERLAKQWPWLAVVAALVGGGGGGSYLAGINPVTLLTGPQRVLEKLERMESELVKTRASMRDLENQIDDIRLCRERRRR